MKDIHELLNEFESIQDLPVSEEMLGAYIEGNLNSEEILNVENAINSDLSLLSLETELRLPIPEQNQISTFFDDEMIDFYSQAIINSEESFEIEGNRNKEYENALNNDYDESDDYHAFDLNVDSNDENLFNDLNDLDMDTKAKATVTPIAGYALYKTYKTGAFGKLKDLIFGEDEHHVEPRPNVEFPSFEYDDSQPNDGINIEEADTIHGQPAQNIEFDPNVYQYYDDTCAIQSQHIVLQQFGIDVTQEELIQIAKDNGWYAEGYGTPREMVGKLLEYYGIDIHGSEGNNIFNLSNELAQGHQVIVAVDAYELVFPEETQDWDTMYGEQPNHALVVVGIDTTDPDNVQVIVTDPGNGNRQMAYPADQFIDAWKDSDCFMVTTDDTPTDPTFPYQPVDNFGSISTETLHRLSGMDIDMTMHEEYDHFVNDLLYSSSDLDSLIAQYDDLFSIGDDDDEIDLDII